MASANRRWMEGAACARPGVDPELFFAPDGESPTDRPVRLRAARAVCLSCPVRAACRTAAVHEPWAQRGIRAGLSTLELRRMRSVRGDAAMRAA